jgi:hypothetical protein
MAEEREPEAESPSILEDVGMSRRGFLNLGIAAIAGLSLFWTSGCGSSQEDSEEDDDEEEENGGGNGNGDGEYNRGGGGGY